MSQKTPIIVILGSTATGKTKLSIELAQRFNGEVISADSMQVYKGLDISTAKATPEERSQAVHHMLDVCDLKTTTYTVADFRDTALPIIEDIISRGKVPIIVGGTTYYIESLLWKVLINDKGLQSTESNTIEPSRDYVRQVIEESTNSDDSKRLHEVLHQIDPVTADQIHTNNKRKILRALEIYVNTGRTKSSLINDQQSEDGGNQLGGPLRFENIICFWLKCNQDRLDIRINRRIEGMVAQGMLAELRQCYNDLKLDGIDASKGIMQAIGFKEFLPYLEKYENETVDAEITEYIRTHQGIVTTTPVLDALKLLEGCLDALRLNTKRYSKKQLKWVKNRLVLYNDRVVPPIYELDGSHAEISWQADVFSKAENVVQSIIDNVEPNHRPIERKGVGVKRNVHASHYCDDCQRKFIGDDVFSAHLRSQRHKKVKKSRQSIAQKSKKFGGNDRKMAVSQAGIIRMISVIYEQIRAWIRTHIQPV